MPLKLKLIYCQFTNLLVKVRAVFTKNFTTFLTPVRSRDHDPLPAKARLTKATIVATVSELCSFNKTRYEIVPWKMVYQIFYIFILVKRCENVTYVTCNSSVIFHKMNANNLDILVLLTTFRIFHSAENYSHLRRPLSTNNKDKYQLNRIL